MTSRSLILLETRRGNKSCGSRIRSGLAAPGDGGDQKDAIAFLQGAGFAAEEADVFFVEVDVEELADLALVVADVAAELGEAGSKLVEGVGDGGRATVHFRRTVGEAAEGRGNFDGYGHPISPSRF